MSFDITKLYVTNELTRKTIRACGEVFDVFVRRLPVADLRKFAMEIASADPDQRSTAGFAMLAKALRNEDGTAFVSAEQLRKIDPEAIGALLSACVEVNKVKPDEDELGKS